MQSMVFCFAPSLFKQASNGRRKNKNPHAGVSAFCLFVELRGQKSNFFEQDLLNLINLK
jgi:hypothetical protein